MNKLMIVRDERIAQASCAFIMANWRQMVADGAPLAARFGPYKVSRSVEQNNLMWVWLGQISRDVWVGGRQYEDEVWNIHAKRELLPEENAKGKQKWAYLPDGSRELQMSTTDLNVSEMAEYMTKLQAWAAVEHGVTLHVLADHQ